MRHVDPEVFLLAYPSLDEEGLDLYLQEIGAEDWSTDGTSDAEKIIEVAGRLCYRSWKPGLNPNVVKVREGNEQYIQNIISQKHGSVFEHAQVSFILHNVSRVLTHEIVRHRVGCAISQESLRYVRLTDLAMWQPDWALRDDELQLRNQALAAHLEDHQRWMSEHFKLDDPRTGFDVKKLKTSYMRRWAPQGVATAMLWSANFRTLRHVIQLRTEVAAEEEIRIVFDKIADLVTDNCRAAFGDFQRNQHGEWVPRERKI